MRHQTDVLHIGLRIAGTGCKPHILFINMQLILRIQHLDIMAQGMSCKIGNPLIKVNLQTIIIFQYWSPALKELNDLYEGTAPLHYLHPEIQREVDARIRAVSLGWPMLASTSRW